MTVKAILEQQIRDTYEGILDRADNGWTEADISAYLAGASNTLNDLANEAYDAGLLSLKEREQLETIMESTIDTLE